MSWPIRDVEECGNIQQKDTNMKRNQNKCCRLKPE
jgi:hypothetical protein